MSNENSNDWEKWFFQEQERADNLRMENVKLKLEINSKINSIIDYIENKEYNFLKGDTIKFAEEVQSYSKSILFKEF